MLYEEGFTQNREISWLRYNERVLEEALDDSVPLFERLRFISIFVSNLEEFFRVRVGSLLGEDDEGIDDPDPRSGMTAAEQLRRIHDLIPGMLIKKDMAFAEVESRLAEEGVVRMSQDNLSELDRGRCFDFFRDRLRPHITAQLIEPGDSLPVMDENRPYIIVSLDSELEDRFGILDIPRDLPYIFVLNRGRSEKWPFRYILTEDIIRMFADVFFIPFITTEVCTIDIARNVESAGDSYGKNKPSEMRELIRRRRTAPADKLIVDGYLNKSLRELLVKELSLDRRQIFHTTRVDLSYLDELEANVPERLREKLFYPEHTPRDQRQMTTGSVIGYIRKRDVLSAYPYDSMDLFLELLREASVSDEIREIRITIYRLASNPVIAEHLMRAARYGKKVRVLLELRARFDEERNLAWAEKLRRSGCRVHYGPEGYKVHSKLCQIVTEDRSGRRAYITQISTGNYNEKTASKYTDLSLITADRTIGESADRLFRDIWKEKTDRNTEYGPLMTAPHSMHEEILRYIRRETAKKTAGRIFFKVNAITDKDIIEALMEASCAGCRIRMICSGSLPRA